MADKTTLLFLMNNAFNLLKPAICMVSRTQRLTQKHCLVLYECRITHKGINMESPQAITCSWVPEPSLEVALRCEWRKNCWFNACFFRSADCVFVCVCECCACVRACACVSAIRFLQAIDGNEALMLIHNKVLLLPQVEICLQFS